MRSLFHQVEAGVFFMFVATVISWFVILYSLGLGMFSLWITSLGLVYFIGKTKGSEDERRRQNEFDHKITRLRER